MILYYKVDILNDLGVLDSRAHAPVPDSNISSLLTVLLVQLTRVEVGVTIETCDKKKLFCGQNLCPKIFSRNPSSIFHMIILLENAISAIIKSFMPNSISHL